MQYTIIPKIIDPPIYWLDNFELFWGGWKGRVFFLVSANKKAKVERRCLLRLQYKQMRVCM